MCASSCCRDVTAPTSAVMVSWGPEAWRAARRESTGRGSGRASPG
uniref:Uncharacterized protein n=1 Tax=Human herpesvirus 2 TaxID=10310 RepID=A0A481TQ00_HHV2|nr:hypothetical protein [Human alphaherpesvirus 2]QBH78495.1 hypothetical protein [Human alphaherpesvirus 2]QBH80108.1 hypothetical protein [Human alphaherpesvirus 2]QBH82933.1 hypothetical protein [Human alphaherpesvirus 2]QBH84526.1 hypothetical protein [Human alphaherpesvirus 2]